MKATRVDELPPAMREQAVKQIKAETQSAKRSRSEKMVQVWKTRKRYRQIEFDIQRSVIKWWKSSHALLGVADPRLLMFIPNAGITGGQTRGAILNGLGLRPGVPDLFLAVPRDNVPGVWIELKKPGGHLQLNQKTFHEQLRNQGFRVHVSDGVEQTKSIIISHLTGRPGILGIDNALP